MDLPQEVLELILVQAIGGPTIVSVGEYRWMVGESHATAIEASDRLRLALPLRLVHTPWKALGDPLIFREWQFCITGYGIPALSMRIVQQSTLSSYGQFISIDATHSQSHSKDSGIVLHESTCGLLQSFQVLAS